VKLLVEDGDARQAIKGGDKEWGVFASFSSAFTISISIAMSHRTEENRVHFLDLPAEIHLEILRQLIGFQGNQARVGLSTWRLKGIRL
jgi:hypothetical protein